MLFWQRTCPVAQKSIAKAPNQKDARQPKCFSFFFLFFFFRWASSKLCESFMIVSYKTAVFYIEQCTSPWLFHNFEVSHDHKAVGTGHQTTMASFAMPFSSLVHMRTNHLAAKCNYYPRLLDTTIFTNMVVCMKTGRVCHPLLTQCWLSQTLHTSTEVAYDNRFAALWWMATFSSSMHLLLKISVNN